MSTVIAAIRSVATYLGISLYVLLAAPPGLLVAFVFKKPGVLYDLGHIGVRLGLVLSGIRCEVSGLDRLPRDRAVVFCANHQSNVDPPILFTYLHRRLHVLFKAELLKLPLLGRVFRRRRVRPRATRQPRAGDGARIGRGQPLAREPATRS